MMDYGQGDSVDLTEALVHTPTMLSEPENRFTYRLVQVERDGSFVPHSDDEYMEVEHLLAEPRNEMDFVDGVLNFDYGKCLENECFPCAVDYQQLNADRGDLCPSTLQEGREDSKFEFVDGMLRGADDVHLCIEDALSNALDDYLLDTEFSEKVPDYDYAPSKGPQTGIHNLDNHFQGLNERGQGAVEISNSVTPTVSVPEAASDKNSLDKLTMRELQRTYKSTFGRETSVKDKPWLKRHILFGLHSVSCLLQSGVSSKENGRNLISTSSEDSPGRVYCSITNGLSNKNKRVGQRVAKSRVVGRDVSKYEPLSSEDIGASQTHKRLRRPTQRYIEESSHLKSRSCSGKIKLRTIPKDDLGEAKTHYQHHRKAFGATPLVYRDDATRECSIQVPFTLPLHVRKRRSKKNASLAGQDSEDNQDESGPSPVESQHSEENQDESGPSPVDSQDDSFSRARSDIGEHRRKLHKMWTLSEVMLLVDGVSQYGVGRWTEIKRLLFSASAHRSSVDLKDKWRNLLRASNGQSLGKRKVAYRQKQAKHSIPRSVLQRVSELANIYPYPRERKSKIARPASVSTPMNSTTCVSSVRSTRRACRERV
ncbi:Telomere repeat-binding protein [Thalictrum thalictroides]|uniref:Telomere repeat-binding protein n=1 Tax=Thalictrum thalictroides TaxID=46969 RepID=A0A7J6X3B0_THATH|nr:Telomere repeat-binding protein [Thalictrum thalictroides]